MGAYDNAGKWRANTEALNTNAVRVQDYDTPGTGQKDTATVTTTARTNFTGFEYTGKDAVTRTITGLTIPKAEGDLIKWAILEEIQKDEVDTVIEVTADADECVVSHYGSGTLVAVTFDTTRSTLSRGDLPS